jgi:two-component system chemotaxis response regulator CheB
VIGRLPGDFPLPVALSCERSADERDALLGRLQAASRLPVNEPDDKDDLEDGHVYLSPAGYHLVLERGAVALARDPQPAPPSPGPLFESAADTYGAGAATVLLFGAAAPVGSAEALQLVRERGGLALMCGGGSIPDVLEELRAQPGRMDELGRRD